MWLFTRSNTKAKDPYSPYIDEEAELGGKNDRSTAVFIKQKQSALSKSSKQKNTSIEPIQFDVEDNKKSIISTNKKSVQVSQEILPGKFQDQSDLEIQEVQDVSEVNIDLQLA